MIETIDFNEIEVGNIIIVEQNKFKSDERKKINVIVKEKYDNYMIVNLTNCDSFSDWKIYPNNKFKRYEFFINI